MTEIIKDLYQFTEVAKTEFWAMLDDIGQERDFYYLAAEAASVLRNDYGVTGVLVELLGVVVADKEHDTDSERNRNRVGI